MTKERDWTVAPGSRVAREQGCMCPVIDNHYGHGAEGRFVVSGNCPLHRPPPSPEASSHDDVAAK